MKIATFILGLALVLAMVGFLLLAVGVAGVTPFVTESASRAKAIVEQRNAMLIVWPIATLCALVAMAFTLEMPGVAAWAYVASTVALIVAALVAKGGPTWYYAVASGVLTVLTFNLYMTAEHRKT